MESIRNVQMDAYDIDPVALSTSGVSSCIAIIIEIEDKIFIFHASSDNFNASLSCSTDDAYMFLMKIYDNLNELDAHAKIDNIFIIGGWNNQKYLTLRNQIDVVRDRCAMKIKSSTTLSSDNFDLFINKIKFNLIGFNLPAKRADGADKEESDDDNPDDYIVDFTVVYDRSSIYKFVICQYAGNEDEMTYDRDNSSLKIIYEFDQTSKNLQAFIFPNPATSVNYLNLLQQVQLNVKDPARINHSSDHNILKKQIFDLLARIEPAVAQCINGDFVFL